MTDINEVVPVGGLHPADGVMCSQCGMTFRVDKLDEDGGFIVSSDTFEIAPNYCPMCGRKLGRDEQ